jgi:hypothetical protein
LEELFARLEGSKTNCNFADEAKNNLLKGCPTSAIIALIRAGSPLPQNHVAPGFQNGERTAVDG